MQLTECDGGGWVEQKEQLYLVMKLPQLTLPEFRSLAEYDRLCYAAHLPPPPRPASLRRFSRRQDTAPNMLKAHPNCRCPLVQAQHSPHRTGTTVRPCQGGFVTASAKGSCSSPALACTSPSPTPRVNYSDQGQAGYTSPGCQVIG